MRKSQALKSANQLSKTTKLFRGLITSPENIVASQASNYTYKTRETRNDQTHKTTSTTYYEDFYDMNEDLDIPFITPEEERKIHCILELARKGKINPQNAFQIPVKVVDPELVQNTNSMFWKFASELLHVSIHVYDKRVENVFQNTHKMSENLFRAQKKSEQQQQVEELSNKSRKKRNQLFFMNIEDVGKCSKISRYEIGVVNCEDKDKLNKQKSYFEYFQDPLFKKRLQEFDSNTLSKLFLNELSLDENLEISLFLKKKTQKIEDKVELKQQVPFNNIPKFISNELKKLNFIVQNNSMFQYIEDFKMQNIKDSDNPNQFKEFVRQYNNLKENNIDSIYSSLQTQDGIQNGFAQNNGDQNTFIFKYVSIDEPHCYSQQFKNSDHQMNSSQIPFSEKILEQLAMEQELLFIQSKAMMNPWQLEFKGLNLQKKRRNKSTIIKQSKSRIQSITNEQQIDWSDTTQLDRSQIYKAKNCKLQRESIYYDKNLLPMSMDIFIEIHNLRKQQNRKNIETAQIASNNVQQQNYLPYQFQNANNEKISVNRYDNQIDQKTTIQNQIDDLSTATISNQTTYFKTFGLRNIRQLKEHVYQRVMISRSLKISDLNIPLTPAGILIIFLHLVNERNFEVLSIDDETDILIQIPD